MNVLIAPDSFKESADAVTVAEAIARGVRQALPDARIDVCPMADGGQGTVEAMLAAAGGERRTVTVRGPLSRPIAATFGLLDGGPEGRRTAVIEMAAASGLMLVPPPERNPLLTTTYGTGQLLAAALDCGVDKVLVGIGGSATTDGGAGLAQALGVRFLDRDGGELPAGLSGGQLDRIALIDASGRDGRLPAPTDGEQREAHPFGSRLNAAGGVARASCPCRMGETPMPRGDVQIVAACDVDNPLTGPNGAAAVYGPQKGATPEMIAVLDANLAHLARLIERDLGVRIADRPGAGAAGGLGGGLVAFCGATLRPGIEIVIEATRLADRVRAADLVVTGEGRLDSQSLSGKTAIGVGRLARRLGVPAIAIVGSVGPGAERALDDCLHSCHAIKADDMPLSEAMRRVGELLEEKTAEVMRSFR